MRNSQQRVWYAAGVTIYRHRLSGTNPAGDIWSCTFHSQSDLILTTVHPAVTAQVEGDLLAAMAPLWTPGVHATEFVTDQLEDVHGHAVAQQRTTIDVPGTSVAAQPGQGASVVVGWVTERPGRKGRGRIFLPGPAISGYAANGLLSDATATAVKNAAASMLADIRGTTVPVLLELSTVAHVTTVVGTTTITDARVNVKPSYQRRRLNKVNNLYH